MRRAFWVISIAGLILMALAFGTQASQDDPAQSPVADAARISEDVHYLASDELEGRAAGSPGAVLAGEYIAGIFRDLGVQPAGEDYFREFAFTSGIDFGEMNFLDITTPEGTSSCVLSEDFVPLAVSADGTATGGVVFAGYGISAPEVGWDDYADIDVRGEIAFCLLGEPHQNDPENGLQGMYPGQYSSVILKARTAQEHGATALILVTGPVGVPENSRDGLFPLDLRWHRGEADIPVIQITRATAERLWGTMDAPLEMYQAEMNRNMMPYGSELEGIRVTMSVDLERTQQITANVVAVLPGSDPVLSGEYVIIGAHYDHLGIRERVTEEGVTVREVLNGADDNASGVAGVLELVRLFSSAPVRPSRNLLFICFDAEEKGLLGSYAYIGNPAVPLDKTVAMINMDMIGRARPGEDGVPVCTIQGTGSCEIFGQIIPEISPDGQVRMLSARNPVGGGDYVPFYNSHIPILNFFTGEHPEYNTPNDDAELINYEGMASIVGAIYQVASGIADYPGELEFNTGESQTAFIPEPGTGPSFSVYLGTIPDFTRTEGGFWISGVTEGSPAEAAGLMAGDRILKLGEYEIVDIFGYTTALGNFQPGDVADVVVFRDGEEITLSVTFGSREEERDMN